MRKPQAHYFYTWIIYYACPLILPGIFFFRTLFQLPGKTLLNFFLVGFIFILAAVVLENVAGKYSWSYRIHREVIQIIPEIFILYTIEEFLEMFRVSFLIYSILKFPDLYKVPATI